jgi:hypothetical protein
VDEISKRSQEIEQIKAQQQPLSLINPIRYHLEWAKLILRKMDDGTLKNDIEAPLQAIRIGNLGISAAPGEVFNEI